MRRAGTGNIDIENVPAFSEDESSTHSRGRGFFWLIPTAVVVVAGVVVWGMFTVQPVVHGSGAGRGVAVEFPANSAKILVAPATESPEATTLPTPDIPAPGGPVLGGSGVKPATDTTGDVVPSDVVPSGIAGVVGGLRKAAGGSDLTRTGCLDQVAARAATRLVDTAGRSSDPGDTSGCGVGVLVGYVVGGDPAGVEQASGLGVRDRTGLSSWGNPATKTYGYTVVKSDVPGMQGYILTWATAQ